MIINTQINRKSYDDILYDTRPAKLSEYLTNKYNVIHNKIYMAALESFIKEWLHNKKKYAGQSDDTCKRFMDSNPNMRWCCGSKCFDVSTSDEFKRKSFIYEIMPDEYWQSSKVKIMTKYISLKSPNLSWTVDLSPWWNEWQSKSDKTFLTKKVSSEKWKDAKLTNLDYINGIATFYSKTNDDSFEVPFDYLTGEEDLDDDFSLANTFTQKLQNL